MCIIFIKLQILCIRSAQISQQAPNQKAQYYKNIQQYSSMKKQSKTLLPIDITPQQYANKITKQLGNHFVYAKLSSNEKWNDPRLNVLSADYFRGKTILDIGCNEGILAIPIAMKYQPKNVHAIDIDSQMVKKAKNNMQIFINKNEHYKYPKQIIQQISTLPLLLQQTLSKRFGDLITQLDQKYQIRPKGIDKDSVFPNNIQVYAQNILAPLEMHDYDCILCMNVTRWIHLAYGDQGIKKLFTNIQQMSNDGTILILESQSWSSYRKKKNLYPSYKENYKMILHKPERFKDYLQKLGFILIQTIAPTAANLLKHQILIFQKKARA